MTLHELIKLTQPKTVQHRVETLDRKRLIQFFSVDILELHINQVQQHHLRILCCIPGIGQECMVRLIEEITKRHPESPLYIPAKPQKKAKLMDEHRGIRLKLLFKNNADKRLIHDLWEKEKNNQTVTRDQFFGDILIQALKNR